MNINDGNFLLKFEDWRFLEIMESLNMQMVEFVMPDYTFFVRNWKWLALLAIISFLTCLIRFGWVYPDSENYILLVSFFRGEIPITETVAPFSYRPLLPLIASLLPFPPELVISILNIVFIVILSWTLFLLSTEFGYSKPASFAASGICSFSWVVAYYGAVVLVDAGAVLCLSIALLLIYRDSNDYSVALFLLLGTLFKEIALVGVLASILWQKKLKPFTLVLPPIAYFITRYVFSEGQLGYIWNFHLESFTTYLIPTIKTIGLTLGPFAVVFIIALLMRKKNADRFDKSIKWLVLIGIPCILIFLLGLFMAHFDSRFVWPLYPPLIPITAYGFDCIIVRMKSFLGKYSDGLPLGSQDEMVSP